MIYRQGYVPDDIVQQGRDVTVEQLASAETEFRTAMRGRTGFVEWREAAQYVDLPGWLATESRAADVLLTSSEATAITGVPRSVEIGALVFEIGGPVLLVPSGASSLLLQHALIAWVDTPQTRRAVKNALPMLKKATRISVVEIAGKDNLLTASMHVRDVVSWLSRHGIEAKGLRNSLPDTTRRRCWLRSKMKARTSWLRERTVTAGCASGCWAGSRVMFSLATFGVRWCRIDGDSSYCRVERLGCHASAVTCDDTPAATNRPQTPYGKPSWTIVPA